MRRKPERPPPGLPSVHKLRADRQSGRYAKGSPALVLGAAAAVAALLVGYRFTSERDLDAARNALKAKQAAVANTVGAEWFPLRDSIEKLTLDAAKEAKPDHVDPKLAQIDYKTEPGIYLRLRVADARDAASLRRATQDSQRDGFVGCLLREPNTKGTQGVVDGGAFPEQPWNWQKAYSATRILTDDWLNEVNESSDPLRLKIFQEQFDKAMRNEIPTAVDIVKHARFFLLVLDEDSKDAEPAEAGEPVTLLDLEKVGHFVRIHLFDLGTHEELLRLRTSAEAGFVFARGKPVTDPETLDAMKRQVNNCALAKEVDRAVQAARGT